MNLLSKIKSKASRKAKAMKKEGSKKVPARKVDDYLRFVVFLAVIGMAYIWNSHYAEKQMREMEEMKVEVKTLKDRYIVKRSSLSAITRYSEISQVADSLGLRPLNAPPYKLIKAKEETGKKKRN